MRSRRRGGVCAANRLASQPKQGVSRDSIETDMIPIGDGNFGAIHIYDILSELRQT